MHKHRYFAIKEFRYPYFSVFPYLYRNELVIYVIDLLHIKTWEAVCSGLISISVDVS